MTFGLETCARDIGKLAATTRAGIRASNGRVGFVFFVERRAALAWWIAQHPSPCGSRIRAATGRDTLSMRAALSGATAPAFWLALVLLVIGWFAFCPHPIKIPLTDDVQHFMAFAVLGILCQVLRPGRRIRWLALGLLAVGAGIEGLQWAFTATRHAEWRDFASDAAGVVAALAVIPMLAILRPRRRA